MYGISDIRKRTPKFVGEIQAMSDNNPSKSLRSTDRHGSLWVSYLVGGAWKHSLRWERANSYHKPRGTNILFFSDKKNFCQDHMVNSRNNHWLALSQQNVSILMKTKWIKRVAARRPYDKQRVFVPYHISRTKSWLSENFFDHIPHNIWLLNYPYCNHHD